MEMGENQAGSGYWDRDWWHSYNKENERAASPYR
jgi:hypothetical protein